MNIKAEMGEMPFLPERTGSFWSKQAQVDVLAINWRTKDILLGECKWGAKPVGVDVMENLFNKTPKALPAQFPWRVHYAFFARSGFTESAQTWAEKHNAQLVDLARMEADMQRWLQMG